MHVKPAWSSARLQDPLGWWLLETEASPGSRLLLLAGAAPPQRGAPLVELRGPGEFARRRK